MRGARRSEALITMSCHGISRAALAFGMRVAGSPAPHAAQPQAPTQTASRTAGTALAAVCGVGDACDPVPGATEIKAR